jgi:nucleoside-diphosphate-sugar epimerase
MATIFVTGAAGFIGAATSHALLARGDHVEVDETYIGGKVRGEGSGPKPDHTVLVSAAVEVELAPWAVSLEQTCSWAWSYCWVSLLRALQEP